MDNQRARRTLARRLFILVGPAAIIGHPPPLEEAFLCGVGIIWVVDQDDRDLAVHVLARIIVPAQLRRVDTIADEYQRRIFELGMRRHTEAGDGEIIAMLEAQRCGAACHRQRRMVVTRNLHGRHSLQPAALLAARAQPYRLELADDVIQHLGFSTGRGGAAFQIIGGQCFDHIAHQGRIDFGRGRNGGRADLCGRLGPAQHNRQRGPCKNPLHYLCPFLVGAVLSNPRAFSIGRTSGLCPVKLRNITP